MSTLPARNYHLLDDRVLPGFLSAARPIAASRPWFSGLILGVADLAAVASSFLCSVLLWSLLRHQIDLRDYLSLWPAPFSFPLAYAAAGLYLRSAIHTAEQMRRAALATASVYFLLGSMTFVFREAEVYSRAVFLLALVQTLIMVPLVRGLLKSRLGKTSAWGSSVVVIGAGTSGLRLIEVLQADPSIGLHPVALLADLPVGTREVAGVPVVGDMSLAPELATSWGIPYAIVTQSKFTMKAGVASIIAACEVFPHLMVIPDLLTMSSLWVETVDLGGFLGLETRQQLLRPGARLIKRVADIAMSVSLALILSPLLLVIACLVKLGSPGPCLYGHRRCGRNGRAFLVWKFRSMVQNADRVLDFHLTNDPSLRSEWNSGQKLSHDPRVTPIGRFLRKTSLDELPQLWNVLTGEMSLVGPRPIMQEEISRYQEDFVHYGRVKPGVTGLWQVSGRNRLTYQERVRLDVYYVRNWSPWLDIYILARTAKAVCKGDGAC